MTPAPEPVSIEAFRDAVARHLGLWFEGHRLDWLNAALERRLAATRQSREQYLAGFAHPAVRQREIAALAPDLTVNETFFFRYPAQFRALADVVLPDRMAAHAGDRRLRVLSAGCASGEEAYSIAITAREVVPPSWELAIVGVDISADNVARAGRGCYSDWALRATPDLVRARWFTGRGRNQQIASAVRDAVRFRVGNLAADDPELWAAGSYDAIFLRNVLIYFTPEQARAVVARAARALQPGGYLFLGHAETLRGLSTDFALRHTRDAFYYQRLREGEVSSLPGSTPATALAPNTSAPGPTDDWIGAVARSAARIESLGARSSSGPATAARTPPADGPALDTAQTLLREERYPELEALIAATSAAGTIEPALLAVAAAADTHRGRIADAEAACARLITLDPLNADAYGLLALCREAAGDAAAAEQHDEAALYLDPDRPMPHVHLGLLARRRGDRARARRFFERALALLPAADEDRLRLAGAGLGRDGLIALCRGELERLRRPA